MIYYIVSDIHGCFNEFYSALQASGFKENSPKCKLIVCGDVFDRGKQAVELLTYLNSLNNLIYIRGNHEDLMDDLLTDIRNNECIKLYHVLNGTLNTLVQLTGIPEEEILYKSNMYELIEDRLDNYYKLVSNAIDYYETENYIFVHGWIPLNKKGEYKKNWRKADWGDARWANPMNNYLTNMTRKIIVCGHWYSFLAHQIFEGKEENDYTPYYGDGFIMIDGCTPYSGIVNVIKIEDEEVEKR